MIPNFPQFKILSIEDKEALNEITKKHPPFSDYNFTSLWSYNIQDDITISNLYDNLVVKFRDYITNTPFYSFIGNNKVDLTIETLIKHSEKDHLLPILRLIPEINLINQKINFDKFLITEDRDNFDYIFSLNEMKDLSNSKYEKKRYWVNKFIKLYPQTKTIILSSTNQTMKDEIITLFHLWTKNKNLAEKDTLHELKALQRILQHAHLLSIIVLGIYDQDQLIAFSITESLNKEHSICHFVKADTTYKGIFEYLYKETAMELYAQGHIYFNREQDLGLEGLRKAKTSWHPTKFLKKYTIQLK